MAVTHRCPGEGGQPLQQHKQSTFSLTSLRWSNNRQGYDESLVNCEEMYESLCVPSRCAAIESKGATEMHIIHQQSGFVCLVKRKLYE